MLFSACTDLKVDPDCYPKEAAVHVLTEANGRVVFYEDLNVWAIRYFVPGTIDSYYTGVACYLDPTYAEEGLQVIYSGELKPSKGKIQPSMQTGGEEFYFLKIESIRLKN